MTVCFMAYLIIEIVMNYSINIKMMLNLNPNYHDS